MGHRSAIWSVSSGPAWAARDTARYCRSPPGRRQDRTGGFTAWIPWTFQKENTELDGKVDEAGGFEYLKTLAVSRLFLDNIRHVQGSWVTQGAKIGQVSLSFGGDDLGSIMIEENVVYAAGARNKMSQ